MKKTMRRSFAMLMALVMAASLFFGINVPTQAATINYVKSGKYIYNWGERGETATFLSPMAEDFYEENNTSYEELAALAGSSSVSSVPSSALYKELQSLMKSNHKTITSYGDTRPMYQYTDCQNSGSESKAISSFYSGVAIGPEWDAGATWNREHVWPNSKGLEGSDEDDIMMLRPTSKNENFSRGNKAYGESSGYYNPNSESNGAYDVRGDVARIALYTYVRWGNTGKMWSSSGVIESKEILIKWMKEDPVDTWELGRNDSVEAITGTRNVFVDYPELAFDLFEEAIPANYSSPSGEGANQDTLAPTIAGVTNGSTYYTSQTVTVSDENLESVTVNGKEVGATFTLDGNVNQKYTIIATDKSGNQTTVVVTMKIAANDNQNEDNNSSNNNGNNNTSNNNTSNNNNNAGSNSNTGNNNTGNGGNSNNNNDNNNQNPVANISEGDDSEEDVSSSEGTNSDTESSSNTEEKNDNTSESDKDDVEDESNSKEEQKEENGKFPMEIIFLVMLIVGVVALVALIISDRKAKGNNNTKDEE